MLYYIAKCPTDIKIPTNDFQAIKIYPNHTHLYNKKFIAESQNIRCGTQTDISNILDQELTLTNVIVRPMTNLGGMGKGTYYLNDIDKISEISKKDFWCEIFQGEHISIDIFHNKYGILGSIGFKGIPGKLFTFNYWEYLPNYQLPPNIILWINTHLKEFVGVFNLELIDNKIIECHLRMGDLNYFQNKELTKLIIQCHQNKKIKLPSLPKIWLIPIFVDKGKYLKLKEEDIWNCARKSNSIKYITNYFIDPPPNNNANPIGGDRICNLTVTNLEKGLYTRNVILQQLSNKNWWNIF